MKDTAQPLQALVSPDWLSRYRNGERARVWAEMTAAGSSIRQPEMWAEARAVAAETMARASVNVRRLVEGLPTIGYEFQFPKNRIHVPPAPTIEAELDDLERTTGPMPLSLRVWYEHVGTVNLMGTSRAWPGELTDPLVVEAPLDFVRDEFDNWVTDRDGPWGTATFRVSIAPDALHKANISGGPPYELEVPNEGADGLLFWEPGQTTLVSYLRHAFRWAGLPGWDPTIERHHAYAAGPVPAQIQHLAATLEAI